MYMTTVREPDVYMFESEKTFLNPKTKEKVKFASVFEKSSINLSVVVPAYNEEQRSEYTRSWNVVHYWYLIRPVVCNILSYFTSFAFLTRLAFNWKTFQFDFIDNHWKFTWLYSRFPLFSKTSWVTSEHRSVSHHGKIKELMQNSLMCIR